MTPLGGTDERNERMSWNRSLLDAIRSLRQEEAAIERDLAQVERLYLDELMSTQDAKEGLQAFLDKRDPSWSDR